MDFSSYSTNTRLAFYMLSGCGDINIDAEKAVVLLEGCVKENDDEAMWMLGLCCEYGLGTEPNTQRAALLYNQSCEAGNIVGEFLCQNGEGVRGSGMMKVESLRHELLANNLIV